jgi:hypothetical protein
MNVGQTIFQQIRTLTPTPIYFSWGASKFQTFNTDQLKGIGEFYIGGLVFYARGAKHKGHVVVTLAGNDTYTVSIGHLKNLTIQPKTQIKDVYFDELADVIDNLIEKQDFYQY